MKKTQHWKGFLTLQRKEIVVALKEAKEHQKAILVISPTGLGKSDTVKLFLEQNPQDTFVITVGDSFKLEHVIHNMAQQVGAVVEPHGYKAVPHRDKLQAIADRLAEISIAGGYPVIILDEAENLKPSVLKTIKELYDAIIDYCGIVMIGTDQILDSLLNRRNKNRMSVPQLYRRFKAGIRNISALNKGRDFKAFFDCYIPNQPNIQAHLIERADNYGELHDFLEPVLRHCANKGVPVTEELFCHFHKIPTKK
jgi:type II secretory pathway predicted ATPase ExeA